jgi:glycosyltransferase involved in cell wall biosynthesis
MIIGDFCFTNNIMKLTSKTYQRFNDPATLLVVSSFPLQGEEIAKRNAVSRYSYLLLKHFPDQQRVVVLCEQVAGQNNQPYLLKKNILVIPSYPVNSFKLFTQLNQQLKRFSQVKNILLQFEFSLFGKEVITFILPFFFIWQRVLGKKIYTMLHQVVLDLSTLVGQVALPANSIKTLFFNGAMRVFYSILGLASQKILVHDQFLAEKLCHLVPQRKLAIIPHGINGYQGFRQGQKDKFKSSLGCQSSDQLVLAYGYHSWYKGTDWLINNFLRLKKAGQLTKNTKLLLAGDAAPTQKSQPHLQGFYHKLSKLIKNNSQDVIHTGFVPEKEVAKIFAVANLVVFPYRARMSSSGALALAWQYRKPFICSKFFAENLTTSELDKLAKKMHLDINSLQFNLNYASFAKTFINSWQNPLLSQKMARLGRQVAKAHDWQEIAGQYLDIIKLAQKQSVTSVKTARVYFWQKLAYSRVNTPA